MSELSNQITEDMKTAMRAKDADALTVIRGLKAAIKNAAIEQGGADTELDDAGVIAVVRKQLKQREESAATYDEAKRDDLASKERAEIIVLEKYLPTELGEDEVAGIIDAAIAETGATSRKEMGAVMQIVQEKVAGRADNKTISQVVMAKLS